MGREALEVVGVRRGDDGPAFQVGDGDREGVDCELGPSAHAAEELSGTHADPAVDRSDFDALTAQAGGRATASARSPSSGRLTARLPLLHQRRRPIESLGGDGAVLALELSQQVVDGDEVAHAREIGAHCSVDGGREATRADEGAELGQVGRVQGAWDLLLGHGRQ